MDYWKEAGGLNKSLPDTEEVAPACVLFENLGVFNGNLITAELAYAERRNVAPAPVREQVSKAVGQMPLVKRGPCRRRRSS